MNIEENEVKQPLHFGFIGFGLIGGSVAQAIKRTYPDCKITVSSRTLENIEPALADGTADDITTEVDERFKSCDMIFLCTPVSTITIYLRSLKEIIREDCILTDVGSAKALICSTAEKVGLKKQFIGGHPMAGSEKTGYAYANADILKNRPFVLTPNDETDPKQLEFYKNLVESFGCRPYIVDAEVHDKAVAAISHVPHLAAATLVQAVKEADTDELMFKLASTGFLDTTRVAASSSEVWKQIVAVNTPKISEFLGIYIDHLTELKARIDSGDTECVAKLFNDVRPYRQKFDKR